MKKFRLPILPLVLLVINLSVHAQVTGPVDLANASIDRTQVEFVSNIKTLTIDPGVRNLLERMMSVETDSIQRLIPSEANKTEQQKILALHSHLYFMQAFQHAILNKQFEQYHIRDARLKYWDMWDRMRNGRPYDCLLYTSPSPRDRQKSRMPSSA